jgi:quinoprotein glucose dehydrogenase
MRKRIRLVLSFLPPLAGCFLSVTLFAQTAIEATWPYYGGDSGGMRYSNLSQINRENVSDLKVAWTLYSRL